MPTSTGAPLPQAELELRILDAVHHHVEWCDPDSHPVVVELTRADLLQRVGQLRTDHPALFRAIIRHEKLNGVRGSRNELLRIEQDAKLIDRLDLTPVRGGFRFHFDVWVYSVPGERSPIPADGIEVPSIAGLVSRDGHVAVEVRHPVSGDLRCPVCLARGMRIGAPGGPVQVEDVQVGMKVWTTDRTGHRVRTVVVAVGRTPVPPTHKVVRLVMADGRTVLVSPGHPAPDGTLVGDLRVGQRFEGTRVVSADRISYAGRFTYDLLPSGPTGTYFANGVLLSSTLARAERRSSASS